MTAWIGWLFDTASFMTRSHCGPGWSDTLRRIYIVSNISIGVSYFAIPVLLGILYRSKRHDLPSAWMLGLFGTFILLCGLTHFSDVLVFYWAPYRLFTLLFVLTGIASLATTCTLPRVVVSLVKLPSREYVHAINNRLQVEATEKKILALEAMERERLTAELNAELRSEIDSVKAKLQNKLWYTDRISLLASLDRLNELIPAGAGAGANPGG